MNQSLLTKYYHYLWPGLIILLFLAACNSSSDKGTIEINFGDATQTVTIGGPQVKFVATGSATTEIVTWSLVGPGSIPDNSTGTSVVYTPPTEEELNKLILAAEATAEATLTARAGSIKKDFIIEIFPRVNTAPTITEITLTNPVSGTVEQNTGDVAASAIFAVTDAEDALADLVVTASSSNQAIVADASLNPDCSDNGGISCTLSFIINTATPGTATITVRVSDSEGEFAEQSVGVSVTEVTNTPPTITEITLTNPADGTVEQNSGDVAASAIFAVTDAEDALADLVVTASSSNQAIVADDSLNPGCSDNGGISCTLDFTINTATTGTATITVKVTDSEGDFAEQSVSVTVTEASSNTPPTITEITLTNPGSGTIDQNTGEVAASANFAVTDAEDALDSLTITASSNNQAIVADASLNPSCSDNGGISCTLAFSINTATAGTATITVKVTDSAGAFAEQSVSVAVTVVNPCDKDNLENNDTFGNASSLGVASAAISSLICNNNDVDFFSFSLTTESEVSIDINAQVNGSDLDSVIELFDANKNLIDFNDDQNDNTRDSFIARTLTAGNYFIRVASFETNSDGPYNLVVTSTPTDPCVSDPLEVNNDFTSATSLGVDNAAISSLICNNDDVDFFSFSLTTASEVSIDINAQVNGSDLDSFIDLFDANKNLIDFNDDQNDNTRDSFLTRTLPAGNYFIRVASFNRNTSGLYELRVSSVASTGGIVVQANRRAIIRPDSFAANGSVNVSLPNLGANESITVIPVHASQDLNVDSLNYQLEVANISPREPQARSSL